METVYSFWEDSLQRPLGNGGVAGAGHLVSFACSTELERTWFHRSRQYYSIVRT